MSSSATPSVTIEDFTSLQDNGEVSNSSIFRTDYEFEEFQPPSAWKSLFIWTVTAFIITFNLPVFYIMPKVSSVPSTSKTVMLSLATTDLCLGLVIMTRMTYFQIRGNYFLSGTDTLCRFDACAVTTFALVSVFHLEFVLLDRLLLVVKPLTYPQLMTGQSAIFVVGALWMVGASFGLVLFFNVGDAAVKFYTHAYFCCFDSTRSYIYSSFILLSAGVIPIISNTICTVLLFHTANKQLRTITAQEAAIGLTSRKHRKFIRTLICMVVGFYVFWSPFFVFVTIWEMVKGRTLGPNMELITTYLAAGNSFLNPLIYVPTISEYRNIMLRCFHLSKSPHLPNNLPLQR